MDWTRIGINSLGESESGRHDKELINTLSNNIQPFDVSASTVFVWGTRLQTKKLAYILNLREGFKQF